LLVARANLWLRRLRLPISGRGKPAAAAPLCPPLVKQRMLAKNLSEMDIAEICDGRQSSWSRFDLTSKV
jgi:hypothetical protein